MFIRTSSSQAAPLCFRRKLALLLSVVSKRIMLSTILFKSEGRAEQINIFLEVWQANCGSHKRTQQSVLKAFPPDQKKSLAWANSA
jgi:hypothetical protein